MLVGLGTVDHWLPARLHSAAESDLDHRIGWTLGSVASVVVRTPVEFWLLGPALVELEIADPVVSPQRSAASFAAAAAASTDQLSVSAETLDAY